MWGGGVAGRRSAKFRSEQERHAVTAALEASPGDLLLLVADEAGVAARRWPPCGSSW